MQRGNACISVCVSLETTYSRKVGKQTRNWYLEKRFSRGGSVWLPVCGWRKWRRRRGAERCIVCTSMKCIWVSRVCGCGQDALKAHGDFNAGESQNALISVRPRRKRAKSSFYMLNYIMRYHRTQIESIHEPTPKVNKPTSSSGNACGINSILLTAGRLLRRQQGQRPADARGDRNLLSGSNNQITQAERGKRQTIRGGGVKRIGIDLSFFLRWIIEHSHGNKECSDSAGGMWVSAH